MVFEFDILKDSDITKKDKTRILKPFPFLIIFQNTCTCQFLLFVIYFTAITALVGPVKGIELTVLNPASLAQDSMSEKL